MGRSAQIRLTDFGRDLPCVCRYRRAKAQYGGDDFLHESLPFTWRWKRNSAVRQVNVRFEVGLGRRGASRRASPLTLSANALYIGQVVTRTAAKLPH
jgi:hypothetical protein